MTRVWLLASLLWLFVASVFANPPLPPHYPVPGGIAVINLDTVKRPDKVLYKKQAVLVTQYNNSWYAVVGLSLATRAGKKRITVKNKNTSKSVLFTVKDKKYKTQHITIKDKRKVNPYKKDMDRIIREKKTIGAALRSWTYNEDIDFQFSLPVAGRFSSPFGLKRFFNHQARRPHSGLDIAAKEGTPILAPAAGMIINTGNYFFNGNTIFMDHGQGLVTMYFHMNKIDVKVGQFVLQGEQIGAIGMTGRVTGPHLHWGVSLNNARIEPRLLLPPEFHQDLNINFK